MIQETGVQSQVESYQRLKKWYLMLPCLTLSITKYVSRVKYSNPGNGVSPFPTLRCSSYPGNGVLLYCHLLHHNDTIIKTQEDFFRKIYTSQFICKGSKRLFKVCVWEGVGDRTELQYFDSHSYGRQRCVFLVLQGCTTGDPEAHSARLWLSLLHLISNFPGPQLIRGPRHLRPDVAFLTTSRL